MTRMTRTERALVVLLLAMWLLFLLATIWCVYPAGAASCVYPGGNCATPQVSVPTTTVPAHLAYTGAPLDGLVVVGLFCILTGITLYHAAKGTFRGRR